MEWSNEAVLEFLDLYENESIVWNACHNDHKKRNIVYDAWKRIERNMGGRYSVAELKKKKDSLMASFRACQNKVKESTKSGAGTADIHKPNWFAYEKMASFLKNRNQAKNTLNSENLASQLSQDEPSLGDPNSEENDSIDEPVLNNTNLVDTNIVTEETLPPNPNKAYMKPHLQKKKKVLEDADLKRKMDEAFSIIQSNAKIKEKPKDFCDKYGEIVAERLRHFDERTRDIAINRIDNLLFQMKINPAHNLTIVTAAQPQHSPLTLTTETSYGSHQSSNSAATTFSHPSPSYETPTFEEPTLCSQTPQPVYETLQQCYASFR